MKYLLMIYADEAADESRTDAAKTQRSAAYAAYAGAMAEAGVMVGGERLHPSGAATTVRLKNGQTELLNGPYADTREQLGGYFMIDVPDLDAALHWAARCPGAAHGAVEVRPIWAM
jgi:hypothetical protein